MAKRKAKAKKKSAKRAKPSKVQRTLVRLEKAIVEQARRIDGIIAGLTERVFHEEQSDTPETVAAKARQARDVMSKAAGVLVDPE